MNIATTARLAAAASIVLLSSARAETPAGVQWETTSQVVMPGMPMSPPPQTVKVCTHATWTQPPPGGDPSCVTSNFTTVGNKATWTVQCSGQMPMQGTGEITFNGTDSYTGAIAASAGGMNLTINLTGRKIGTCDKPQ